MPRRSPDGDSLITVGAVDSGGLRASFSSIGPTYDGRVKPDLMARGVAAPLISASSSVGYTSASGTSFSCPIVAGLAACLMLARPVGPAVDGAGALRLGLNASVVATAVALLAFAASLALVPADLPPKAYYEILFWGGGHALQFTWTLLMLVAWLTLAQACGGRVPLSPRVVLLLFALALASVFITPLAYLAHDVTTVEHRDMHTWGMRFGGGLAIIAVVFLVTRLLVLGVAVAVEATQPPPPAGVRVDDRPLLASVTAWDGRYYLGIADEGYHAEPVFGPFVDYAFFPLYPIAIRAASVLTWATRRWLPSSWPTRPSRSHWRRSSRCRSAT